MKTNKKLVKTQRQSIDEKLAEFKQAAQVMRPKTGWIKAIRQSLGMTTQQLAKRMGIHQTAVVLMEQREQHHKITLELLERAAQALNCRLVYSLVPQSGSLEQIYQEQSVVAAQKILQLTALTMALEKQNLTQDQIDRRVLELAEELRRKVDSKLWSE